MDKKKYNVWWYWNEKAQISPLQKSYFLKKDEDADNGIVFKIFFSVKKTINILLATYRIIKSNHYT